MPLTHNQPIPSGWFSYPVPNDKLLKIGTDIVLVDRSTILAANTALTGVLVGTPVTPALAANSLIISDITASGGILVAANRGGNSEAYIWVDAATGNLNLYQNGTGVITMPMPGIGATATSVLTLTNTTAATAGAQKYSPAINWHGNGWTTTGPASQTLDWRAFILPIQNATNALNQLVFQSSIAGAAYGSRVAFTDYGAAAGGTVFGMQVQVGTNAVNVQGTNTGGTFALGLENSVGGSLFTGTGAYALVLGSTANARIDFVANGALVASIPAAGGISFPLASSIVSTVGAITVAPVSGSALNLTVAGTANMVLALGSGQLQVNQAAPTMIMTAGTGTNAVQLAMINTGGTTIFSVESSVGATQLLGSTAYASVLGSQGARNLEFGTNNNIRWRMDATTGALMGVTTMQLRASTGVISFSVVSTALTQGSAGSMVIPYADMGNAANDAARDVLAGNLNSAVAIDSVGVAAVYKFWARANGVWKSVTIA